MIELKYREHVGYVNNPKVACSTIKRSLIGYNVPNGIHHPSHFKNMNRVPSGVPVFSVVRNPFDRALSGYLNKVSKDYDDPYTRDEFCNRYNLDSSKNITFLTFLKVLKDDPNVNTIDPHFRPQHLNLGCGVMKLNFIGRIEAMRDVAIYLSAFGIELITRTGNKTDANSKLEQYYSDEEIDLVKVIYKKDFEEFSYSYELCHRDYLPPIINYKQELPDNYLSTKMKIRCSSIFLTIKSKFKTILVSGK